MKKNHLLLVLGVAAVVVLATALALLPAAGAASSDSSSCATTHVVKYGETAAKIAQQYGVTVAELAEANDLENPNIIYSGQTLCIPDGDEGQTDDNGTKPVAGSTTICVDGLVIDTGHNGIGDLAVLAQDGQPSGMKATTDEDGAFAFDQLTPGEWTFRVEYPELWENVTAAEFKVEVDYGHIGCYNVRFKLRPLGCVIVTKTDGEGNPLADWPITVSGPVDPEDVTNEDGIARFDGLVPGTYLVEETVLYPWKALTPSSVSADVKAAWSEDDCALVEFQNEKQPVSCVIGQKVDDQHRGIGGWKISARSAEGLEVDPQVTDDEGLFMFDNLTLGTWTLSEEVQDGWTPITPAEFTVMLTEESKPPDCVEVRFKNRPPDLCAEGYKVDENGVGLAGWTVKAYPESDPGGMSLSTTTDSKGYYRFNGLTLDNWIFSVEPQVGWTPIDTDFVKVPVVADDECIQVPIFRNQSPRGCVEGYKKDDLGAGLAGWNISLEPVGGGSYLHVWTDGTGYFRFDDLAVGEYEVWEEAQTGWSPQTPTKYVVKLVAQDEYTCEKVEFVNQQVKRDICIDGYKLDEVGEAGLPDFTISAKNVATGEVQKTDTNGLGYFRFGNLEPGKYEVSVEEQEGWAPSGPSMQTVTVSWPPKYTCSALKFFNKQVGQQPEPDPDPGECTTTYTVQSGDTLAKIAQKYGTTASALASANDIEDPDLIYPGQVICVPDP